MTIQRRGRNAQHLTVYGTKEVQDSRGNWQIVWDVNDPHEIQGWVIPQRSNRGEVPGQIETNVVRIGITHDLPYVNLQSRVYWNGAWWDVEAPPSYHHGTRHVRHWSIDLRQRPGQEPPPPRVE